MKWLMASIICFLLAGLLTCEILYAGQGMGPGPGNKVYSSGGGTQPASGTLLAGISSSATAISEAFNPNQEVFSTPSYTATWSESASTTTASAIRIVLSTDDDGINIKCLLRNSVGVVVATTTVNTSVPTANVYDLPFIVSPAITKGAAYQMSCISDGYQYYGILPSTGAGFGMDDSGSYATPATTMGTLQNIYPDNQMFIGLIK